MSNQRSYQTISETKTAGAKAGEKTSGELTWTSSHAFQGWTCSQCEWNYPVPTLLNDPEARTAYDRLAVAKFREHDCAGNFSRMPAIGDGESFTARIRKLVSSGFKPKDAAELMLKEVELEYRRDPKTLARAKVEADDFLRRVKAGLI